jgi:hypothetical protein
MGKKDPDEWLQAYFKNKNTYPSTRLSRAYVNPENGITPRTHVSVTVPWWSELENDPDIRDKYVDWYKGGRIYFFDTKAALDEAHEQDKNNLISFKPGTPRVSCADCGERNPLPAYWDEVGFDDTKVPFQLMEYTFVSVNTVDTPFIIDLNVGYNVSYLDQIYLPMALEPSNEENPFAVGYLGTIQQLGPQDDKNSFRDALNEFVDAFDWPQYKSALDNQKLRPHLPGTYKVLVDRVNVVEKGEASHYTTPEGTTPPGRAIRDLIEQWQTCTKDSANAVNCPQFEMYQQLNTYFKSNYAGYREKGNIGDCPNLNNRLYYPVPNGLTDLNIMPYVYGWVQFNSGCKSAFNDLEVSPGPKSRFNDVQFDYIHYLQYNYEGYKGKDLKQQQWFNPFVRLVHSKEINASSYAFSVDDAAAFQSHPGEGLIISIGGAKGLPNDTPVRLPANYTKDFLVTLGNSIAQGRPRWKSFGVCKQVADQEFPPLPKNATIDTPQIVVDTIKNEISDAKPCTITIKDAIDRVYQFTVKESVPWPQWNVNGNQQGPDPSVVTIDRPKGWNINEVSKTLGDRRFDLATEPPLPRK